MEFCNHYFSASFWANPDRVARLACEMLGVEGDLRSFKTIGHGARFFKDLRIGPAGAKLYLLPYDDGSYCHLEMSGQLTKAIGIQKILTGVHKLEQEGIRIEVARLDLAFDTVGFHPSDVAKAIVENTLRSLAKRETAQERRDLHGDGYTVTLGSRSSERYLRVYFHKATESFEGGCTRVELELKDDKADQVFHDLMDVMLSGGNLARRSLGHLRDFVDFGCAWWKSLWAKLSALL